FDVEHVFHVQYVQHPVRAECDGARTLARADAVVEQLELDALVAALRPREDEAGHSGVRHHAVRKRVVDGLVAADFESTVPRALDEHIRRRDHEEQVDVVAEARQEVASGLVRVGREAVETEAVDQQMGHFPALGLAGHVGIEFPVDDLQLLARERAAVHGRELQIIDRKLDSYMARKAERGEMTHLLIDRFRFDSFAPDSDEAGSNLLTRFGHDVHLFFMITPPDMLVERAWNRGLEIGRYKAVDDTLAHGVVAYSGMPGLIFTWAKRSDKRVQFELLDNSVRAGERPRTVAFGSNRVLYVLDVKHMLDVE